MFDLAVSLLKANKLERCVYAEPYAGGCGLALSLLFESYVSEIFINDLDVRIWSFWHSIINETAEFLRLLAETPLTIDEWQKQREIVNGCKHDAMTLGFATFYLNRTNRSGIIKGAGIIGGYQQMGAYKMDCRFNRADLARRIKRVARYGSQIQLSQLDAIEFMENSQTLLGDFSLLCIDPPYFKKGSSLYTSFYSPDDHADVAEAVKNLKTPWIVTYDDTKEVRKLYNKQRKFVFDIKYSVQTKRTGTELLIPSKGLRIPKEYRRKPATIA